MPINLEVKGTVAKLLAQENLLVEHRQVQTAQFNVETRVLTLPIWDKATDTIFDLLVAHEVGHALYTPNEDWTEKCKAPQQFINVVEDVRIEKLIKRRFPGLGKTFYRGYQELNDMDFFMIAEEDISKMNLADRVNLQFKIGAFLGIKFTKKEEEIINMIDNCENFEDALLAAEVLYQYCKKAQEEESTPEVPEQNVQSSGSGNSQGESMESDESFSEEEDESDNSSKKDLDGGATDGEKSEEPNANKSDNLEPSVDTMNSLEENLQDLINTQRREFKYIERPEICLDRVIIKNSTICEQLESFWNRVYEEESMKDYYVNPAKKEYKKYKNESQKEVNYLVKEFECKKSADSYARASVSRTGVLDCTKLHTYKYNEDLFKKVTTFADGKNHGLIFVLDWSGSMSNVLGSTVKQLLNLVWFCRKVKIPFKVYGFTNAWHHSEDEWYSPSKSLIQNPIKDTFWIDQNFRMLEFLDSNCSSQEFERQCINFWCLTTGVSNDLSGHLDYPPGYQLSGTPLNEALIMLHKIIPAFKTQNKLQKLHTIILTDGEAAPVAYCSERYFDSGKKISPYHVRWGDHIHIRDRKLRTTYLLGQNHTISILKNLQDNFPETNFIGIRIASGGELSRFLLQYVSLHERIEKIREQFKKEKSASISIPSFTKFFVLNSNSLHEDTSFNVEEGAGKATIRAAFKKSLTKSKFNRKILSEFISFVA